MRRRRGIMGLNGGAGIPVITATATGNPLTFETDLARPLKSLVIPFTPIQAAGTPSPDNPLPISGRTGCEITHTGKNLLSPDDTGYGNYTIGSTGNHITGGYARLSSGFIPVSKGDVLTLGTWITLYKNVGFGFAGIAIYDKDKQFVRRKSNNNIWSITATIGEGEKYIRAFSQFEPESESAILTPSVWSRYKIQLERASSRTTYESYTGSTLSITFADPSTGDPLTIYGGTLTLNEDESVDLVATWIYGTPNYSKLGINSWSNGGYRNSYNYMTGGALAGFPYPADHKKIISDKAVRGSFKETSTNPIVMDTSPDYIYFGVKSELLESDTLAGLRAYLVEHAPVICYPLKQKDYIAYHFDNVGQLITFVGTNNIWTDTNGTNTATYLKHQS